MMVKMADFSLQFGLQRVGTGRNSEPEVLEGCLRKVEMKQFSGLDVNYGLHNKGLVNDSEADDSLGLVCVSEV